MVLTYSWFLHIVNYCIFNIAPPSLTQQTASYLPCFNHRTLVQQGFNDSTVSFGGSQMQSCVWVSITIVYNRFILVNQFFYNAVKYMGHNIDYLQRISRCGKSSIYYLNTTTRFNVSRAKIFRRELFGPTISVKGRNVLCCIVR